jgi:hypothetical protein
MKRSPGAAALLCGALGLSLQLLTLHFNYGGNPTALVTPRVWLELTPQVLGILRGLV